MPGAQNQKDQAHHPPSIYQSNLFPMSRSTISEVSIDTIRTQISFSMRLSQVKLEGRIVCHREFTEICFSNRVVLHMKAA
jgi:hypothetical protein